MVSGYLTLRFQLKSHIAPSQELHILEQLCCRKVKYVKHHRGRYTLQCQPIRTVQCLLHCFCIAGALCFVAQNRRGQRCVQREFEAQNVSHANNTTSNHRSSIPRPTEVAKTTSFVNQLTSGATTNDVGTSLVLHSG